MKILARLTTSVLLSAAISSAAYHGVMLSADSGITFYTGGWTMLAIANSLLRMVMLAL